MSLFGKLRGLILRRRLEADMDAEMRAHLALQAEENIRRGMSAVDARHAASREFGGLEQIKERVRDQRSWIWLEHLAQDLRFGARTLRKSPAFALVAVMSLAVGIGLNTAVFSIINALFHQTIRGVPEPARVMFFNAGTTPEGFAHLRDATREAIAINATHRLTAAAQVRGIERIVRVDAVSENYFSVLQKTPVVGRFFSDRRASGRESHEPEVLLEENFWRRELGGDRSVLGEIVRINRVSFTVVGVVRGVGIDPPPLQIPLGAVPRVLSGSPGLQSAATPLSVGLLGRLRPGVTRAQAQAAVEVALARERELFGETRFRLSAGREDWRGEASAEKRVEKLLVTVVPLVVVGALLWIACSNVSNLLLARAVQRQRELAVRVASGASRGRLVRMMLAESSILALLGGAAGLWVSQLTLDFVFATLSQFGALHVEIDGRVLFYTTGMCVVSTLLFGLLPALRASRVDINSALKGAAGTAAFRPAQLRRLLLASQIASSVALLVVAGTFVKTLLTQLHGGEQAALARELLIAQLPADEVPPAARAEFHQATAEKLRRLPGIAGVSLTENARQPPLQWRASGAGTAAPAVEIPLQRIDAHYLNVMGIRIQRGAALPAAAAATTIGADALVNEPALALLHADEDPAGLIGRLVTFADARAFRIAGVVRDGSSGPMFYTARPLNEAGPVQAFVRTRGDAADFKALVSAALRAGAAPGVLPRVATYRETAFRGMSEMTRLACFIGALALALAASGIYASTAFSGSQRVREIGVRLALGATRADVFRLVLGEAFRVVAWGSAVGACLGLVGLGLLARLMFGRWFSDGVAVLGVIVFFAAVASLAAFWPARRATKVDPMLALRAE